MHIKLQAAVLKLKTGCAEMRNHFSAVRVLRFITSWIWRPVFCRCPSEMQPYCESCLALALKLYAFIFFMILIFFPHAAIYPGLRMGVLTSFPHNWTCLFKSKRRSCLQLQVSFLSVYGWRFNRYLLKRQIQIMISSYMNRIPYIIIIINKIFMMVIILCRMTLYPLNLRRYQKKPLLYNTWFIIKKTGETIKSAKFYHRLTCFFPANARLKFYHHLSFSGLSGIIMVLLFLHKQAF